MSHLTLRSALGLEDYDLNCHVGQSYPSPQFQHPVPLKNTQMALEELVDGKPVREIEHTIYARVVSMSELENASSMEMQEQWEIRVPKTEKNAGKGSFRIRKTQLKDGDPTYALTTKISASKDGDKIELAIPTNADNFEQFKFLSEQGMIKHRYHFPVEGTDLIWEIDMFPKEDGTYHEWCKIDLEVKDRDAPIPTFPIDLADVILPEGYGRTDPEEAEKAITALYDDYFLTKNTYLAKLQSGDAEPKEEEEDTDPVEVEKDAEDKADGSTPATEEAPVQDPPPTPDADNVTETGLPDEGTPDDESTSP